MPKIKLILNNLLPPGDVMTMTSTVRSLHTIYPNQYETKIESNYPEIWENNPFTFKNEVEHPSDWEIIKMKYPWIHKKNASSFIQGYVDFLEKTIKNPLELTTNKPDLYLTEEEKSPIFKWLPKKYIVFNAGVKNDFTLKQWPVEYYEKVVKNLKGKIDFVQIGLEKHNHHPVKGAINLVGKTNLRQLFSLVYNSDGCLCPVTLLQHIAAAFDKKCCCIVGGREHMPWASGYMFQTTLHRLGTLPCCSKGGCWKSKVFQIENKSKTKINNYCEFPIGDMRLPVGKCMANISPMEVTTIINSWI